MTPPGTGGADAATTPSRGRPGKTVRGPRGGPAARPGQAQVRQLDVPEIVRAARSLVDSGGLEVLSMRALARELGVSHMAAYYHVGHKDDLLALLVDDVLARIEVPPPDWGSWEDRLRELNRRSTAAMATVPGIDQVMLKLRPTVEGWRLIDAYVGILLDAGFSERQAAFAFSVIHSYGMGRSGMEQALRHSPTQGSTAPSDSLALRRIEGFWKDLHRPDYQEFALEVIIAGLRSVLAQEGAGRSAPRPAAGPRRPRAGRAEAGPHPSKGGVSGQ
jgi:AcrR family transcriptional regulator